ncbi:YitT family protein [Rhodoferax sp.]|uniref:YitT family protein n=1 Tax=Rhodoferax sp. TaxID=50421 RepID=UPI001EC53B5D|nr:YitT family protein [Rhodoferax sp.]MBT9508043.1 YitT family protein [Rhodoferax sp.]
MPESAGASLRHRPYEDVQALITGTLFVALGVVMFGHTGLLTGGTAGIAFLIHYATGWNFGLVFFLVNLPFYGLAWKRMGKAFTLKTFVAIGLLSLFVNLLPRLIGFQTLWAPFAAVMGGLLMGAGMLMLFRHRASLGGFNVLALYLQEHFGWRAGRIQMAFDCGIVLCSLALVDWQHVALSVLGAVVMNQTLATNHRAGRYMTL